MKKCVVCGDPVPKKRKRKDTCSIACGLQKMAAWDVYLQKHKEEITKAALREYLK